MTTRTINNASSDSSDPDSNALSMPYFDEPTPHYLPFLVPDFERPPAHRQDSQPGTKSNGSLDSWGRANTLVNESTSSVIDAFMTDDEGRPLLESIEGLPGVSLGGGGANRPPSSSTITAFSRARSALSLQPPTASDSLPHHAIKPDSEAVAMPLSTFCDLIAQSSSLEKAQILSVECFKEWSKYGVLHRFLILRLQRTARTDVFLRIDRRAVSGITIQKFIRGKGRTEANDVASLAASKEELFNGRKIALENRLEFDHSLPLLRSFRHFLAIICEELNEYHIWPENTWFFCSMLEEHLAEAFDGRFVEGAAMHLDLSRPIRARVYDRIYQIPTGARISELLKELTVTGAYWKETYLPKAIVTAENFDNAYASSDSLPDENRIIEITEILRNLSSRAAPLYGCLLAARAVAFCRRLYLLNSEKFGNWLIAALTTYAERLSSVPDAAERACDVGWQLVEIHRLVYEADVESRAAVERLTEALETYIKQLRHLWSENVTWNPLEKLISTYKALYLRQPDRWYALHLPIDGLVYHVYKSEYGKNAVTASCELMELYRSVHCPRKDNGEGGTGREVDVVPSEIYVRSLDVLVDRLLKARHFGEALEYGEQLVPVFRARYRASPTPEKRGDLVRALDGLARCYFKLNRISEACDALREPVEVYRELCAKDLHAYVDGLLDVLYAYEAGLKTGKRDEEAAAVEAEIADLERRDEHLEEEQQQWVRYYRTAKPLPTQPEVPASIKDDKSTTTTSTGASTSTTRHPLPPVPPPPPEHEHEQNPHPHQAQAEVQEQADDDSDSSSVASFYSACESSSELIDQLRAEYISSPSVAGYTELTDALRAQVDSLAKAGDLSGACAPALEICQIDQAQYAAYPGTHHAQLGASLDAYSKRLASCGRQAEACEVALTAIATDRAHASPPREMGSEHVPSQLLESMPALVEHLQRLCHCCELLAKEGRHAQALDLIADAEELFHQPPFHKKQRSRGENDIARTWRPVLEALEDQIVQASGTKRLPRYFEEGIDWLDEYAPSNHLSVIGRRRTRELRMFEGANALSRISFSDAPGPVRQPLPTNPSLSPLHSVLASSSSSPSTSGPPTPDVPSPPSRQLHHSPPTSFRSSSSKGKSKAVIPPTVDADVPTLSPFASTASSTPPLSTTTRTRPRARTQTQIGPDGVPVLVNEWGQKVQVVKLERSISNKPLIPLPPSRNNSHDSKPPTQQATIPRVEYRVRSGSTSTKRRFVWEIDRWQAKRAGSTGSAGTGHSSGEGAGAGVGSMSGHGHVRGMGQGTI